MGWVYLFVFLIAIWKGNSPHTPYIARMAGIAVIAVFVTSTLGNMLGDRSGGIGMGFLIALSLYGVESTKETSRKRRLLRKHIVPPKLSAPALSRNFHAARKNWIARI